MNEIVKYSDNVKTRTIRIKTIQDNVCRELIQIGNELIEIKKELEHGSWLVYLEEELEYKTSTASNLMRVAREFPNFHTCGNIPKQKIFALLSLPMEVRDDFIANTNLEDTTVRELKAEIQKYKEENGLLTEKQQKALDEKRRIEQEKRATEQELQRERNKPPKVETKVVEKVVEKVVDKTDYNTLDKLKRLEEDNKRLGESKRVYEDAMNIYKKEVEKYQKFKDQMFRMSCVKGGDYDEVKALEDMNKIYIAINKFIKTELSPVQYEYCLNFVNSNQYISESFINMINTVEDWCLDMREKLNQNNNIINVEVR